MSRALIVIRSDADRLRVTSLVAKVPFGTRVQVMGSKRSLPQNDLMWSLLTDVAAQKEHTGRKYTADQWKILFMHACGREVQFMPALDGTTFIPWGQRSSDLSKEEMSELIDFILAWGAENSVTFSHEPRGAVA